MSSPGILRFQNNDDDSPFDARMSDQVALFCTGLTWMLMDNLAEEYCNRIQVSGVKPICRTYPTQH